MPMGQVLTRIWWPEMERAAVVQCLVTTLVQLSSTKSFSEGAVSVIPVGPQGGRMGTYFFM